MLDPRTTDVVGRRIGAWLINLLLVAGPTLLVARSGIETIPIVERDAAGTIVTQSQAEYDYISGVQNGFHRIWEVGDKLYIIDGILPVVLPILVLILTTLVVFLLLPANTGWNPGHKLLGLRLVDENAESPALDRLVKRWAVGWIDAFPWVIPGLAGFLFGATNSMHQHISDKVAGTYVVDGRQPVRIYSDEEWAQREQLLVADPSADLDAMVDVDSRLTPKSADLDITQPQDLPPAPQPQAPSSLVPADLQPPTTSHAAPASLSGLPQTLEGAPASFPPSEPLDIPPMQPEPPAVAQPPVSAQPAPTTEAPRPHTERPRIDIDAEPVSFPKPQHRASSPAARPSAHPSPTWDPGQLADPVDPNNLQAPALDIGTDRYGGMPAAGASAANAGPIASQAGSNAPAQGPTTEPEWDEAWGAWVCFDSARYCWMRHDPELDQWLPMD